MSHPDSSLTSATRRWVPRLAAVTAAWAGAIYSYDFGLLIGGPLVGMVLAANGAVCGSVLAGALMERLCRLWRAPAAPFGAGRGSV